jgi:hypothetical protein
MTSMEDPSKENMSREEELWAARMLPSRQQNLTPQQRKALAYLLRSYRQAK